MRSLILYRMILAGTARRIYRLPDPEAQGGRP